MYEAIERLRKLLMEHGIEYETAYLSDDTYWTVNNIRWHAFESGGNTIWITCNSDVDLTPEQVIAMTVGDKHKDNPRNYKPNGEPKIPNMSVGANPDWVDWVASLEHKEPSNITEAVEQLVFEAICFGGEMGPHDCGGENCPNEGMVHTEEFIRGWVKKISTMIGRSCPACPEIDNPDSYISHLQSALKWHDEHVPRPTNPRNTCAVLNGQNPPDEVLFIHDDGGVMHYLPDNAGTCKDCEFSHMTTDGEHCKWCSVLATHKIDSEEYCDPPNGYNPEPYFDADFYCGFFKRGTHLNIGAKAVSE